MPTDRDILLAALKHAGGHAYNREPRPPKGTQDCTRFAFAVLRECYGERVDAARAELHIARGSSVFENVEAVVSLGLGLETIGPEVHGRWYYCQGWKSLDPLKGGHAWLWYEAAVPMARQSVILQATPEKGPDGRPLWQDMRTWAEQAERFPGGIRTALLVTT